MAKKHEVNFDDAIAPIREKLATKKKPTMHTDAAEEFSPVPPPKTPADLAAVKKLQEKADADAATLKKALQHFDAETPKERKVKLVAVVDVKPSPHNPREKVGDVAELAASVQRNGIISPLVVRELDDGSFEVISGHRRLKAAQKASLEEVPVIILDVDEVQALELNLTEQLHRAELTPLEEANACEDLRKMAGYSTEQIATKLSQSKSWVLRRLALATCAPEVKAALSKGEIRMGDAHALASLPTHKIQVQALKGVVGLVEHGGTIAETAQQILHDSNTRKLADASWKLTDAMVLPDKPACAKCQYNSANNLQPGLFEAVKVPPTCTNGDCFDSKAAAAWTNGARAMADEFNAKVLTLADSEKLYRYGELGHGSKYVEAEKPAPEDRNKRTWQMLLEKLPDDVQLKCKRFVAAKKGKPVLLLLETELLKHIGEHLKLKWALKAEEESGARVDASVHGDDRRGKETPEQAAERKLKSQAEEDVLQQVRRAMVKDVGTKGLTLADARSLTRGALNSSWDVTKFCKLMDCNTDDVKKLATDGNVNTLLGFMFALETETFELEELRELAESHGLNIDKMLEAQMHTARAEALMKGGK